MDDTTIFTIIRDTIFSLKDANHHKRDSCFAGENRQYLDTLACKKVVKYELSNADNYIALLRHREEVKLSCNAHEGSDCERLANVQILIDMILDYYPNLEGEVLSGE